MFTDEIDKEKQGGTIRPDLQQTMREVAAGIMNAEKDRDLHRLGLGYVTQRFSNDPMTPAEDAVFQLLSALSVVWPAK